MLSVLIALATGAAPVAQPTPEELGMLDSPAAFVEVCDTVSRPLPDDVAKELESADAAEKEFAAVTLMLSATSCAAVVRGVAETVAAAPSYRLAKGHRICVDPSQSVDGIIKEAVRLSREKPAMLQEPGITTAAFLLFVLHEMSDCESSEPTGTSR